MLYPWSLNTLNTGPVAIICEARQCGVLGPASPLLPEFRPQTGEEIRVLKAITDPLRDFRQHLFAG